VTTIADKQTSYQNKHC